MTTVSELHDLTQIGELSALLDRVWDNQSGSIVQPALLRALEHSGNYVCGAYESGRLVGGSVGFLSLHDGSLCLHSHVTAVDPGMQNKGIGRALKLHQREWCLTRGIEKVRWTFDPLVRRNAYLNLNVLGAFVSGYLPDHYGEMSDGLNAGDPSDRFVVEWELRSDRVISLLATRAAPPSTTDLLAARAHWLVQEEQGEPVIHQPREGKLLCATPEDIVAMRRFAHDRALRWRAALRDALEPLLGARTHRIIAITGTGDYVVGP